MPDEKPSDEQQEKVVGNVQDVLEKFLACEQRWDKVRVPNQKTIEGLLNKSSNNLQEEKMPKIVIVNIPLEKLENNFLKPIQNNWVN